jgi:DNA-directed RNA polymerase specialized sigma24 family protein
MPPRQQQIALMHWQDHMRTAEIAEALGVAEGTTHAHPRAPLSQLAPLPDRGHGDVVAVRGSTLGPI